MCVEKNTMVPNLSEVTITNLSMCVYASVLLVVYINIKVKILREPKVLTEN